MNDKEVQRKLNQLCKIANELTEEAVRRYGNDALLFYEAEGTFHFMSYDKGADTDNISDRQNGVILSSSDHCLMDYGAW